MNQICEADYLQRPLIEDVVYEIKDDYIRISCPHTNFGESRLIVPVDKDELMSLSRLYCGTKTQ